MGMQIRREVVQVSLSSDDLILYVKDAEGPSRNRLQLIQAEK